MSEYDSVMFNFGETVNYIGWNNFFDGGGGGGKIPAVAPSLGSATDIYALKTYSLKAFLWFLRSSFAYFHVTRFIVIFAIYACNNYLTFPTSVEKASIAGNSVLSQNRMMRIGQSDFFPKWHRCFTLRCKVCGQGRCWGRSDLLHKQSGTSRSLGKSIRCMAILHTPLTRLASRR